MSRPIARVLALLEILQSGGTRTLGDLKERLGVDERTVRRYVTHLLDLDIPVESIRGRYGGYRLAQGFRLPPLMFTDDEAVALLFGLVTGPRSDHGASRLAKESAAAKVRRVLPTALGARVDALLEVTHFAGRQLGGPPPQAEVLLLVAEAARVRRTVTIVHAGRSGRVTERTVQPYGLVARDAHWYLTGLDATIGELRSFRLDRVSAARLGSETFDVPVGFQPEEAVLDALALTPWRYAVSVKVRAGEDAVRSRLPALLATLTPLADEDGWTRVEIRAERLDWLPGVLAALEADLVVEHPDELRHHLLAVAQRLFTAAAS